MRTNARIHQTSPNDGRIGIIICFVLVAIVWIVFSPTLGAQFLNYDDNDYVYENPQITNGLSLAGIRWAFTHFHADNWHPLTTISHMLDCQLFGVQPFGHHFVNVLLHALATILLFLALRRLTSTIWPSAFVAALFAIHPLRVESVAWISERKDVLSGIFFMLTIWAYARYAQADRRRVGKYLSVIAFFALGLLCKPTLVTVPFVLLLLDYWPLRRWRGAGSAEHGEKGEAFRNLIVEKIPLFVLSAVSCVVTIVAQQEAFTAMQQLPFQARFANAVVSYILYIGQLIWPAHLAVLYPYPVQGIPAATVILAIALLWIISIIFYTQRNQRPYLLTGWLWFLGMLVPMIGLVQVGSQPRADRYTYLPSIGFFILLAWAIFTGSQALQKHRALIASSVSVAIIALAVRSYLQTGYWMESESLWHHAVDITSNNYVAQNSLGNAVFEKGRLDEAIAHYRSALEIKPDYYSVHSNLGNALLRENHFDEAIVHLQEAVRINPKYAEAYNNMGGALMGKGELPEAIRSYEKAVEINPNYANAFNNMGVAYLQSGQVEDAIAQYQKAVAINPGSADIQANLGNAFSKKRDWQEAIAAYEAAIRARPSYAKAHNNLGVALEAVGKSDEALVEYKKALEGDPDYPEAHCNLGRLLAAHGQKAEAVAHLNEALRLRPNYEEARIQLAKLSSAQ